MGKLKITRDPRWDYVLVNDFTQPPYFAYEEVNAEGEKVYIRVRKGGTEPSHRPPPPESINFTNSQRQSIIKMLKETLKNPLKYGEFMGADWMVRLSKLVRIFDGHSEKVAAEMLERWLESSCFTKLVEQIRKNQKDALDKEMAKLKLAEEKAKPSRPKKAKKKRRAPKKAETPKDTSSDESLFIPIKNVREVERQAEEKDESAKDTSSDESLFIPIKTVRRVKRRAPKKDEAPENSSSDESLFTPIKNVRPRPTTVRMQARRDMQPMLILRRIDD